MNYQEIVTANAQAMSVIEQLLEEVIRQEGKVETAMTERDSTTDREWKRAHTAIARDAEANRDRAWGAILGMVCGILCAAQVADATGPLGYSYSCVETAVSLRERFEGRG